MHAPRDRSDRSDCSDRLDGYAPLLAAEAAAQAPPGGGVEAADVEQAVWLRLLERAAPPADPVRWLRRAVRAEVRAACAGGAPPYGAFRASEGGEGYEAAGGRGGHRGHPGDRGRGGHGDCEGCEGYEGCDGGYDGHGGDGDGYGGREAHGGYGPDLADGPAARGAPGVEDLVLDAERGRAVREAVGRLPGRCPEVVTALMSRSDPTYRQISRELGISQGSLGPMRSRCLECLRSILTSRVGMPV